MGSAWLLFLVIADGSVEIDWALVLLIGAGLPVYLEIRAVRPGRLAKDMKRLYSSLTFNGIGYQAASA